MNIQEADILNILLSEPGIPQRTLASRSGHSLGMVNRALKGLTEQGYLGPDGVPTEAAQEAAAKFAPQNAVILAAGYGMRMVPINGEVPKGLLEVHGEPLIERLICQLHEVGVRDISVVVGFMKEQYEYLMDKYGVRLLVNPDYVTKNNLCSLARFLPQMGCSYIVPCDVWCRENPFRAHEFYPWYMVSEASDPESTVRVGRKLELLPAAKDTPGNAMIGISYVCGETSRQLRERLTTMQQDPKYDRCFWEEALTEKGRLQLTARVVPAEAVVEIDTYEQLRELDGHSAQLHTRSIEVIAAALGAKSEEITDITVLKKGMTNRSFLCCCRGKKYIMRIPGEGTDQLVSRSQEAAVYAAIRGKGVCDDPVYINAENGYKLTGFLDGARVCDPENWDDVAACMKKLKKFHRMGLEVGHTFDLFGQMEFYETLWGGQRSCYRDYETTKKNVLSLRPYIEEHHAPFVLTHIDAVPDNFLFVSSCEGERSLQLIDWEYAAMQDPHVDLAMFSIYSFYDRAQVDQLLETYFDGDVPEQVRIQVYCYVAVCGLLWSNWCEYKRTLGVEFGEYSLRQYRYAKDFYRLAMEYIGKDGE